MIWEESGGVKSALGERHTLPIKGGKTREKTSTPSPGATGGGWVGGAERELENPPSLPLCLAQHGLHADFLKVVLASSHQARGGDSASRQQAFQKLGRHTTQ